MTTINLQVIIPDALTPRIVAALRAQHGDITAGLTDLAAFKACLRFWIKADLMAHEGGVAGGDAFDAQRAATEAARVAAASDADTIT